MAIVDEVINSMVEYLRQNNVVIKYKRDSPELTAFRHRADVQ